MRRSCNLSGIQVIFDSILWARTKSFAKSGALYGFCISSIECGRQHFEISTLYTSATAQKLAENFRPILPPYTIKWKVPHFTPSYHPSFPSALPVFRLQHKTLRLHPAPIKPPCWTSRAFCTCAAPENIGSELVGFINTTARHHLPVPRL